MPGPTKITTAATIGSIVFLVIAKILFTASAAATSDPVKSRIEATPQGDLILVHEATLKVPVSRLWKAYTSVEGYTQWAAAKAEIDFRIGGHYRTQYNAAFEIGDPGTIELKILNYAPEQLLTLQAKPSPLWPQEMQRDAERLYNVILFERISDSESKVISYGLGYRDKPEYRKMLGFFDKSNTMLLKKLLQVLESPVKK